MLLGKPGGKLDLVSLVFLVIRRQMRSVKDFELAGSCNCMMRFGNCVSPSHFL